MSYTKTDLKSPRDLAVHLKANGFSDAVKSDVERIRDDAKQYDGTAGPAAADGAWNHVGMEDFTGVLRNY